MNLIDCHTHTQFSMDSEADINLCIKKAMPSLTIANAVHGIQRIIILIQKTLIISIIQKISIIRCLPLLNLKKNIKISI